MPLRIVLSLVLTLGVLQTVAAVDPKTQKAVIEQLVEKHGADHEPRIRQGVRQVVQRWWDDDGDDEAFVEFCTEHFLVDREQLANTFLRLQDAIEQIDGHLHEVRRELTRPMDLDTGDVALTDRLLGRLDLAAHVDEDLFSTKVAFLALLNFPVSSLGQRLEHSADWDRSTWARSRMMDRFARRSPRPINTSRPTTFGWTAC